MRRAAAATVLPLLILLLQRALLVPTALSNAANIATLASLSISIDVDIAANITDEEKDTTASMTKKMLNESRSYFLETENVILIKYLYATGHSQSHPELCPNLGAKIKLLILVTSAPAHAPQRTAVRLTWGHFAARSDVALGFMLGTPPETLRDKIEQEDSLYGDIIIGNFLDSYSNLTLKSLSLLEWTATYCPRTPFVLKTDDDMFINIPRLLSFAAARTNASKTLYGSVLKRERPHRNPRDKYYLWGKQYAAKVLPEFATGPAYLLTADCVPLLVRAAPGQPYVRLEDVFITGILANKTGISVIHCSEFNHWMSTAPCAAQHAISLHAVRYWQQFSLWRSLLDGRHWCRPKHIATARTPPYGRKALIPPTDDGT